MNQPICRWGILGAADIARKNWLAIRNAPNCVLTGVASRDPERAGRFVAACQSHAPHDPVPRVFDRYEAILASDEVDAVYIPLPTGVRKQWAVRAAEAGKHVLVEKPAGAHADDVREMLDACRRRGVQFMDGVMFLHSRRLDAMREVLDDGRSIGALKRMTSLFSFRGSDEFFQRDIRTHSQLEPFGALGDLGWYNIRFTLWVMRGQLPQAVTGRILSEYQRSGSPAPVATDFSAELLFPGGVSASFYCSFHAENEQWASICGTLGTIHVADFVLPYYGSEVGFEVSQPVFQVSGCDFNMEGHSRRVAVAEYSNSAANAQETAMFRRFAELALSGHPDPSWGENVLKTQQILDACLASARAGGRVIELAP